MQFRLTDNGLAISNQLLPIFAWYWAYANPGYTGPVPSQHEMPWRNGQKLVFSAEALCP